MINVDINKHIGESYYNIFWDAYYNKHIHYWLKGGRGSLKSSFVFIFVIYMMTILTIQGEVVHCVALRKIKDTIKGSIFQNFLWAINLLNLNDYWISTESPMILSFGESTIVFRGCANQKDYEKIKSIKFEKGICRYAVFEELTEFSNYDEILNILQSIFRSGDMAQAFYMYNPPASKFNWVNYECKKLVFNRYVHHSTYLTAPKRWLGRIFLMEAEILKKVNIRKYNHMYLGEEIGEGLEIYGNIRVRTITDQEIESFYKVNRGIDFGFTKDASHYCENFYDQRTDKLYIFNEVCGHGLTNKMLYDLIYPKSEHHIIKGDSAEPRTINELRLLGLNIIGCKKGKDSVSHGIKWLQQLNEIVIDRKRCPHATLDLETYEYKKDANGNIIRSYPKEPHASASTRYALDDIILTNKLIFAERR